MELLKKLCGIPAPSGNEEGIRNFIIKNTERLADEIKTDVMGNLIIRKKGKGKKIMLSAHMDETGFIIMTVDKKGYLSFSPLGGVKLNTLTGCKVLFSTGDVGIIVEKIEKPTKLTDFCIDLLGCKGNPLDRINIGDTAVMTSTFDVFNGFASAKALNSRTGCYILIKMLADMKTCDNDLYFVFTTQHQIGLRGAKTAAALINPDFSITIDNALCDDFPIDQNTVEIDKGPAIKIMDSSAICHPKIKEMLACAAKDERIQIQFEVSKGSKSDSASVQTTGGGIISGGICVPLKYLNTASETVSINDINKIIRLLLRVCGKRV